MKYIELYITLDIDQILGEFPQVSGRGVHKFIDCIWNKEEISQQRKKRIILLTGEKGDGRDCSNY